MYDYKLRDKMFSILTKYQKTCAMPDIMQCMFLCFVLLSGLPRNLEQFVPGDQPARKRIGCE